MSTEAVSGRPGGGGSRLAVIGLGVLVGYVLALALMFARHAWILDASGRPLPTDFTAVWAAGRLALHGGALSAYDPIAQHAAEAAVVGHDFPGYLNWIYPPQALFAAAGLASLPYAAAFLAWLGLGAAAQGAAVAAITRRWGAAAVALASPWALASLMVGQNGLVTAGLMGLALTLIEERPALAGGLLGLLTYKPQFGLLIPLALVAAGRWRAIAWAAATTLALAALSAAAFGPETLVAFARGLPAETRSLVTHGAAPWAKLQSVFGLTRTLGASAAVGWSLQAATTALAALAVVRLWRSRTAFALKAAGLAAAAVLATPYVFAYDLPVLAVPLAFLWRHRRFDRIEYGALVLAALAVAPFAVAPVPSGVFASLAVAAAVARRVLLEARRAAPAAAGLAAPVAAA
jgi:hypothetical protein